LSGESRGVAVRGNYAYVVARDSGVHVIDVSDGANPVKLKTIKTSRSRGIAMNGNYAYVATRDSGLVILNIADPANPIWSAAVKGIDVENVAAAGNVVGTTFYSSIRFYDVTNPENPVAKGSTPTFKTGNEGFSIAGNYAYVPDGDSLKIFNITDLMAPTLVSKIKTGGYGYTADMSGKFCYVASEGTGVRAINISNPSAPVEDGYYDGIPQSRGVGANGKYIYVAEKTDGMTVYSNDLFPSPAITLTKTITMGNVKVSQFKDSVVTITNSGNDTLKITSIASSSSLFTVRPTSKIVPPGQSLADTIRFTPTAVGLVAASIVVVSNAPTSPDSVSISGTGIPTTGVTEQSGQIPTVYSLSQNYPNPFNPSTTISFGLPQTGHVTVEIFDVLGQRVAVLVDQQMQAGLYNVPFNASTLPSGVYLYRMQASGFLAVHKMMLVK
jgi:hypothetical protein